MTTSGCCRRPTPRGTTAGRSRLTGKRTWNPSRATTGTCSACRTETGPGPHTRQRRPDDMDPHHDPHHDPHGDEYRRLHDRWLWFLVLGTLVMLLGFGAIGSSLV